VALASARFASLSPKVTRIVAMHHPFAHLEAHGPGDIVGCAVMAMSAFAAAKVDIVLSGHLHRSYAGISVRSPRTPILLVQAGTATSVRNRNETNAFNVLRIAGKKVTIQRLEWTPASGAFGPATTATFMKGDLGWSRVE
jgi:predicted phosphodiesterase